MKIDTSTIEGYATMTAEQKLAALESFEYDDHASEIEKLKNANSKANSEAAEWKRKHNALLSDEDKKKQEAADNLLDLQKQLETANSKIAEMEKATTISNYTAKYLALGYDEALARETAVAMQAGEMDKVFANGEKHKAALEAKIKAELMNGDPKPSGAGDDKGKDSAVELAKALAKNKQGNSETYEKTLSYYR